MPKDAACEGWAKGFAALAGLDSDAVRRGVKDVEGGSVPHRNLAAAALAGPTVSKTLPKAPVGGVESLCKTNKFAAAALTGRRTTLWVHAAEHAGRRVKPMCNR